VAADVRKSISGSKTTLKASKTAHQERPFLEKYNFSLV